MQLIALLFSLFLSVVFGLTMLAQFFRLNFYWKPLLFYGLVALLGYLIIRRVSESLKDKFHNAVFDFIEGKTTELLGDHPWFTTCNFLMLTLLPFMFYIFLYMLYLAGGIGWCIWHYLPISMLLLASAMIILITVAAIGFGLYRLLFPFQTQPFGVRLQANEQLRLRALSREIAKKIRTRPVDEIYLSPAPVFSVYLQGNLLTKLLGLSKRVLNIGLPGLEGMTIEEFKALLTHEYAHFSARHLKFTAFAASVGNSLIIDTITSMQKAWELQGKLAFLIGLNPAYWILHYYQKLFLQIVREFYRVQETQADLIALKLYGGPALADGLLKDATNQLLFQVMQEEVVPQLVKDSTLIADFSQAMEKYYQGLGAEKIAEIQADILANSQAIDPEEMHPALKVRLDYARKFPAPGQADNRPAREIFEQLGRFKSKSHVLLQQNFIIDQQKTWASLRID